MKKEQFLKEILTRREAEKVADMTPAAFQHHLKHGKIKPAKQVGEGRGAVQLFWKEDVELLQGLKAGRPKQVDTSIISISDEEEGFSVARDLANEKWASLKPYAMWFLKSAPVEDGNVYLLYYGPGIELGQIFIYKDHIVPRWNKTEEIINRFSLIVMDRFGGKEEDPDYITNQLANLLPLEGYLNTEYNNYSYKFEGKKINIKFDKKKNDNIVIKEVSAI